MSDVGTPLTRPTRPSVHAAMVVALAAVSLGTLPGCGDDPAGPAELPGDTVVLVGIPATSVRQGQVIDLSAQAQRRDGTPLPDIGVTWSVVTEGGGRVDPDGSFVPYGPSPVQVAARATAGSGAADTAELSVVPRGLDATVTQVGAGVVADRFTSDLWLHGTHAYTGTWGSRQTAEGTRPGNTLYVWDISSPGNPVRVDSVVVDAGTVNDVKIRSDGGLAVITHEGSSDGLNGVTLLDLADPAHPTVITRYTQGLSHGVHNVWIEGELLFGVADHGDPLQIIDISTPSAPETLSTFFGGSSFIHDVYVRDGLAFVSHWDAGLVIVDVGNGVAGGSPASPVEVSRVVLEGGNTHNAWYWPLGDYVFVGEESGRPGVMHVVDVSDLTAPRKVAEFAVAGETPHNFWLDEENQVLYMAWYARGLRVVDVSGRLLGRLDLQGREYASSLYNGSTGGCPGHTSTATCSWAPQLHGGLIWMSDMNQGLLALDVTFP